MTPWGSDARAHTYIQYIHMYARLPATTWVLVRVSRDLARLLPELRRVHGSPAAQSNGIFLATGGLQERPQGL